MVKIVKNLKSLITGKRNNLCSKLIKCLVNGGFQCGKLCLCLFKILTLNGKGKVSLLFNSLSAVQNLLLNDVVVCLTVLIKAIPLFREHDLLSKLCHILILVIDRNLVITVK